MGGLWAGLAKPFRYFFSGFIGVGSPIYDKTVSKVDPQISAVSYTRCNYGTVINLVYGTNKVSGNVVDYVDFKATAHTSSQSGKGGGVTTTSQTSWTYSANVLLGICAGQISGIGKVWKDSGNQTTLSAEGMNLFYGTSTQTAWGTMISRHPSRAMNYRRLAYVAGNLDLGANATISNYSFEVHGLLSNNTSKILTAVEYCQFSSSEPLGTVTYIPEFAPYYNATTNIAVTYSDVSNVQHTVSNFTNYTIVSVAATSTNPAYIYYSLNLSSLAAYSASTTITYTYTTQLDANPSDIVYDLLTNTTYGASYPTSYIDSTSLSNFKSYCFANGLLYSPIYTSQDSVNNMVSTLVNASNAEVVQSQKVLKFVPLGDEAITGNGESWSPDLTPIYDLTDDDFIYTEGEPPISCIRSVQADVYNSVCVQYKDRANSYSGAIARAQDLANIQAYGLRVADAITADYVTSSTTAKRLAQLALDRLVSFRNTYTFKLPFKYILLDSLDLVTITNAELGLNRELVRILTIKEDSSSFTLEITAQEMSVGSATPAQYQNQSSNREMRNVNQTAGNSNQPVLIEPPFSLTNNDLQLWIGSSSTDGLWGGCNVWISDDGTTYKNIGTITAPCRQGVLTAELPYSASPDTTNTLSVDVTESSATLDSGTQADANNLNTLCWVDGELLAYETATPTDDYKYNLTYLVRGALNTTTNDHAIGEQFVRMDNNVFYKYSFLESDVNRVLYIKLQSFNIYGGGIQGLEDLTAYEYQIKGSALPGNPDDVLYFTVAQNLNLVQFNWTAVSGDTIDYEIREGVSWEKGSVVATGIKGTSYSTTLTTVGTHTYWISAINTKYNLYSTTPKEYVLYVDSLYQLNIVLNENILLSNGTFSNCHIYNGKLKLSSTDSVLWQDNTVWNSSGNRYYADSQGNWGAKSYASLAVYTSPVVSIGNPLKSVVTLNYTLATNDNSQSMLIEWRYSTDNITFTDWQVFQQGLYNFEYFQMRFTLNNPNGNLMYLDNPVLQIDVPDRIIHYSSLAITNASAGVSVIFDSPFTVPPSVVATPSDGTIAKPSITKTINGFTVKTYNTSDTAITCNVDVHVKGY